MTDPEPSTVYRTGLPILFGMLGLVPVLMLVIGLSTQQWLIAASSVPMAGFFGCAGRAGWVRAQARVALVAADVAAYKRLAARAAIWGVTGIALLVVAVLVLNLD